MVKERMDLLELLRKGGVDGDVDFLREALRVLVEGALHLKCHLNQKSVSCPRGEAGRGVGLASSRRMNSEAADSTSSSMLSGRGGASGRA